MHWMIVPFRRYAEFSGRSRPIEFWMFTLLNVIVYAVAVAIFVAGLSAAFDAPKTSETAGIVGMGIGGVLLVVWWLATLVPYAAVSVRRLHDRDMPGWWYLGFIASYFIPVVSLFTTIAYLVMMSLSGTRGANQYGADPKGGIDTDVFA